MFRALLPLKTLHISENEMREVAMFIIGKEYGLSWATFAETSGRGLCGLILGLVLCMEDAAATTYYLSATGNDASAGTVNSPWKTFNYAMSRTTCGDTLMLKDGEYTTTVHGPLNIRKSCTRSTVFTVEAQNQRKAHLSGDGSTSAVSVSNSAYVTVDGLHASSADSTCCQGNNYPTVVVDKSNHVQLKNLLIQYNNRYQNSPMVRLSNTSDSLIEGTEIYDYHRHGVVLGGNVQRTVIRRLYCNSRGRADIPGGFPSGNTDRGDSCAQEYPTGGTGANADNIFENVISEGNGNAMGIEAVYGPARTKVLGVISLNDQFGVLLKARGGSTENQQPVDVVMRDIAIVTPSSLGIYLRGNKNTVITGATAYHGKWGFLADVEIVRGVPYAGGGTLSFTVTNMLSTLNGKGFESHDQTTWKIDYSNAFNNTTNYSPSSHANYSPSVKPTPIDPQLGSCRVWIPDASPMKGAGEGGVDIGANILYRYQNGELTNVPLWDRLTGEFPHGALVVGVNDIPGESLFDVHKRLNVNTNGCLFPKSYTQGSDTSSPRAPQGLAAR